MRPSRNLVMCSPTGVVHNEPDDGTRYYGRQQNVRSVTTRAGPVREDDHDCDQRAIEGTQSGCYHQGPERRNSGSHQERSQQSANATGKEDGYLARGAAVEEDTQRTQQSQNCADSENQSQLHRLKSPLPHSGTMRGAYRYSVRIEALETEDIDTKVVRRHPLAVECIDATDPAEVVACGVGVKLVGTQRILAGKQPECRFVNPHHQCILESAY